MPAFGIVETQATLEELREEGRWATVPGWVMAQVEQRYTLQEREVWRPAMSHDPKPSGESRTANAHRVGHRARHAARTQTQARRTCANSPRRAASHALFCTDISSHELILLTIAVPRAEAGLARAPWLLARRPARPIRSSRKPGSHARPRWMHRRPPRDVAIAAAQRGTCSRTRCKITKWSTKANVPAWREVGTLASCPHKSASRGTSCIQMHTWFPCGPRRSRCSDRCPPPQ